ncbi:protein of unknown function [Cupriavidus taiwanensis]|nr:protein of unknown function [Cupriavidus taiwanensis]
MVRISKDTRTGAANGTLRHPARPEVLGMTIPPRGQDRYDDPPLLPFLVTRHADPSRPAAGMPAMPARPRFRIRRK